MIVRDTLQGKRKTKKKRSRAEVISSLERVLSPIMYLFSYWSVMHRTPLFPSAGLLEPKHPGSFPEALGEY